MKTSITEQENYQQICAVVVTYRPSEELIRNLGRLKCTISNIVIVDNTPGTATPYILVEAEQNNLALVLRQEQNLGIASALNVGIRYAIERGYEWIATFDQDSQICEGYFEAMLACYERSSKPGQIGILYPQYRDARSGILLPLGPSSKQDVLTCLTSGSMIRAETFLTHGGMEEPFFIDYVDHEYCLRLHSAGLKIKKCPQAVLLHSLGKITTEKILWKKFITTNHSAERRYYISRNRTALILRYCAKFPGWSYRESKGIIRDSIRVFLLETDKLRKLMYTGRGIFDGLFGRFGPRVKL